MIPAVWGGALPNGAADTAGRGNIELDPVSRAGRSASEPNIDDIDMLLPGRWVGLPGSSRDGYDGGGAGTPVADGARGG